MRDERDALFSVHPAGLVPIAGPDGRPIIGATATYLEENGILWVAWADRLARRLRGLSCGRGEIPAELGVRFVAVHRGLYEQSGFFGPGCAARAEAMLTARGWRLLARDGPIATYAR